MGENLERCPSVDLEDLDVGNVESSRESLAAEDLYEHLMVSVASLNHERAQAGANAGSAAEPYADEPEFEASLSDGSSGFRASLTHASQVTLDPAPTSRRVSSEG